MPHDITPYFGTYLGFFPTNVSKSALGEIEIVFSEHGLDMRRATGITVLEENGNLSQIQKLTEVQLQQLFQTEGFAGPSKDFDGFRTDKGVHLVFTRERDMDNARLVVRFGDMLDMLGDTVLFDQKQVDGDMFRCAVKDITSCVGENGFPRLQYGGLHEPEPA